MVNLIFFNVTDLQRDYWTGLIVTRKRTVHYLRFCSCVDLVAWVRQVAE